MPAGPGLPSRAEVLRGIAGDEATRLLSDLTAKEMVILTDRFGPRRAVSIGLECARSGRCNYFHNKCDRVKGAGRC